jgi:ribosome-associated protein
MAHPNEPSEGPEPEADEEDLTSRTDTRRAAREIEEALARLAKALVELRPAWLEAIGLPETVVDAVNDTRAIRSAPARNRQLRQVRTALRNEDWSLFQARVDALNKHGTLPARLAPGGTSDSAPSRGRAEEWTARLLGEGQAGIEALIEVAPNADRTHLRNLVQNVHKARAERRKRAEERLTAAIASLLR